MRRVLFGAAALLLGAAVLVAQTPPQGRGAQGPPRADSPASQRPAQTAAPQTYAADVIQLGGVLFSALCGFCHGRDAMGGETGPDLTRSALVADDVRGLHPSRGKIKIPPLSLVGRGCSIGPFT